MLDRRLIYCQDCGDNRLGVKSDNDPRHVCKVCGSTQTSLYIVRRQSAEAKSKKAAATKRANLVIQAMPVIKRNG